MPCFLFVRRCPAWVDSPAVAKSKKDKKPDPQIENRKARHDYTILETLETGIVLRGSEVKSIRDGTVSLGEGFVRAEQVTRGGPIELWMHGVNIGEYAPAGTAGSHAQHRPVRARKLLAHTREIEKLARQVDAKGMTIVPLKMYFKVGLAKVLIGLARGKADHDKRHDIAKREAQRDMDRALSRRR
jgi:SsrA-binding protein